MPYQTEKGLYVTHQLICCSFTIHMVKQLYKEECITNSSKQRTVAKKTIKNTVIGAYGEMAGKKQ